MYGPFQDALARKDMKAILELCKERNREMDQAMYYKPGTYEKMLRDSIKRSFKDKNLELCELPPKLPSLIGEDNRRLASLCRRQCTPAIGYDFVKGIGSVSYPIMCRRQNGKWIITR